MPDQPAEQQHAIDALLENDLWPSSLAPGSQFTRLADDTDGALSHQLTVVVGDTGVDLGDLYIAAGPSGDMLRFRNAIGGGSSLRVQRALMVLAEAIRRDNAERPQPAAAAYRSDVPADPASIEHRIAMCALQALTDGKVCAQEDMQGNPVGPIPGLTSIIQSSALVAYEDAAREVLEV